MYVNFIVSPLIKYKHIFITGAKLVLSGVLETNKIYN